MIVDATYAKDALKVPAAVTTFDAFYTARIAEAQRRCEKHCGYPMGRDFEGTGNPITEWKSGDDWPRSMVLQLDLGPVWDDSSLSIVLADPGAAQTTLVLNTDFWLKNPRGRLVELIRSSAALPGQVSGGFFPTGQRNIKVLYKYGFGGTGGPYPVPEDLKFAVVKTLDWIRSRVGLTGQTGSNLGDTGATWGAAGLPDEVKEALEPYVLWGIG